MAVVEMYPMLDVMILVENSFDTAENIELTAIIPTCCNDSRWDLCFHPLKRSFEVWIIG